MPDAGDTHRGDGFFPPPSQPRRVTGGIRATSTGAATHASWWSRRWLAPIEAAALGDRLDSGRAYARAGQVLRLELGPGTVSAAVQGTRRVPYEVRVRAATLSQTDWVEVAGRLAGRAVYRARLIAGDMPDDMEAAFARAGHSLFPSLGEDLELHCTCDDWSTPCRHAVAVLVLVGEVFDHDPFRILELRGVEREVLLALLAAAPADVDVPHDEGATPKTSGGAGRPVDTPPPLDPAVFWGGEHPPSPAAVIPLDLQPPPVDAPLLRILGPMPLWQGASDMVLVVRGALRAAARGRALEMALRQVPSDPPAPRAPGPLRT